MDHGRSLSIFDDALRAMLAAERESLLADVRKAVREELSAALKPTGPVSLRVAAEANGVSVRTLRRAIEDGRLPVVRVGNGYRVQLPDVAPALARTKVSADTVALRLAGGRR